MEIVLASSNPNKVKEINEIVKIFGFKNIEFIPPIADFNPIENGLTFEENSLIKAKEAWKYSRTWSLADDSGLCISALNGKPGIYSARYAETPLKRIERVLLEMKDKKNRQAHFACCMTLINPNGEVVYSCTGICEGDIIDKVKGTNGFGYDPIFKIKDDTRTMAELSEEEKNEISHRSIALRKILEFLKQNVL